MNKTDLIESIAERTGLAKSDCARAVDALLGSVGTALQRGEDVSLAGFGNFVVQARPPRTGRNPRTGEAIAIRASKVVKFRPGKGLRDAIA